MVSWPRISFGKKKEQTFGVSSTAYQRRLKTITPSFFEMVGRYLCEARIKCAVDELTAVSVGMGFHTTYDTSFKDNEEAKIAVDNFCEDVGLDQFNSETVKDLWITGNAIFWKKTPAKLEDLVRIPIGSITKLQADKGGNIIKLEQKFEGDPGTIIDKSDIASLHHIAWNRADTGIIGRGLLEPFVRGGYGYKYREGKDWKIAYRPSLAEINEEVEDMMRTAIIRYAPKYIFELGGFNPEDAAAMDIKLNTSSWMDDLTVWYKGDVSKQKFAANRLSTDPRSRLDPFIEHFVDKELVSTQTPSVKLISKEGFTEASSRTAEQIEIRNVAPFQRFFKRMEEREIFIPVIMSKLNWSREKAMKAKVRLNWGPLDKPEVTIPYLTELKKFGIISALEARKNISGMGVELIEGEENKLETIGAGGFPGEQKKGGA